MLINKVNKSYSVALLTNSKDNYTCWTSKSTSKIIKSGTGIKSWASTTSVEDTDCATAVNANSHNNMEPTCGFKHLELKTTPITTSKSLPAFTRPESNGFRFPTSYIKKLTKSEKHSGFISHIHQPATNTPRESHTDRQCAVLLVSLRNPQDKSLHDIPDGKLERFGDMHDPPFTIRKTTRGRLLFSVSFEFSLDTFLRIDRFMGREVVINAIPSANVVQGYIHDYDDVTFHSAADILRTTENIDGNGSRLIAAYRRVVSDEHVLVLTFQADKLPDTFFYNHCRYEIFPFIGNVTQCKNCFALNHSFTSCRNRKRCVYCSHNGHKSSLCSVMNNRTKHFCQNCQQNHRVDFWHCPAKQAKFEALKISVTTKYSLSEACQVVINNYSSKTLLNSQCPSSSLVEPKERTSQAEDLKTTDKPTNHNAQSLSVTPPNPVANSNIIASVSPTLTSTTTKRKRKKHKRKASNLPPLQESFHNHEPESNHEQELNLELESNHESESNHDHQPETNNNLQQI